MMYSRRLVTVFILLISVVNSSQQMIEGEQGKELTEHLSVVLLYDRFAIYGTSVVIDIF